MERRTSALGALVILLVVLLGGLTTYQQTRSFHDTLVAKAEAAEAKAASLEAELKALQANRSTSVAPSYSSSASTDAPSTAPSRSPSNAPSNAPTSDPCALSGIRMKPESWLTSRSNTGNTHLIHRVMRNGTKADRLNVLVMGGSLTAGNEVGGKPAAWPALLNRQLPSWDITNRAVGSTGSVWFLQNLGTQLAPFDWDLVMIEAALNDDQLNIDNGKYKSGSQISEIFEQLIRSIRLALPHTAILIVEAFRASNGFKTGRSKPA